MKTVAIKGTDWYNLTGGFAPDQKELAAAIEICFKKDMENFKKLHYFDKPKRLVELARKYPNHDIA